MPEIPRELGLKMKHEETVGGTGAAEEPEVHEGGEGWIVDEIVEEVVWGEEVIGEGGTVIDTGPSTERGGVDEEMVGREEGGGKSRVGNGVGLSGRAGDSKVVDVELVKGVTDGTGSTAVAEDEGVEGEVWGGNGCWRVGASGSGRGGERNRVGEEVEEGLEKSGGIGVVTHEERMAVGVVEDAYTIDGTDGSSSGGEAVEVGEDS